MCAAITVFNQLVSGLTNQIAYDGLKTDISEYDAGLWSTTEQNRPTFHFLKTTPVCSKIGGAAGIVLEAQLQSPHTDVYVNTKR